MTFTSIAFCLFFLVVVSLYYILPVKLRWIWLLVSSILYFIITSPGFLYVPVIIIFITWWAGIKIETAPTKKRATQVFILALLTHFAVWMTFKFIEPDISKGIILPLGISFIILQAIGYLIEIKRGNHAAEKNPGYLATYLLFFPKLGGGPVERAHHFIPQLRRANSFKFEDINEGLKLIAWGLFKKLVIADRLSIYVNTVLNNYQNESGITVLVGSALYVFQLYADLSGYTDMARGLARILGFQLVINFNQPLFANSVTKLWKNWHMSLTSWFMDYIYKPITNGGQTTDVRKVAFGLCITFVLLGIWHDNTINFVIFGFLQALILFLEFITSDVRNTLRKNIPPLLINFAGIAFTFLFFTFSLIFFRTPTPGEAFGILNRILHLDGPVNNDNQSLILFSLFGIFFLIALDTKRRYFTNWNFLSGNRLWLVRNSYYFLLIIIILLAGVLDGESFIYLQF